jgi:CheY-like chemotaxis protein/anti-sigma regulatory factor (Ser/Thr protein kinase)
MAENPETYAEEFPPDLWRDLKIVYRNCEHLSSLIDDVLDLSQAEAGGVVLHRGQVDLAEVIDSAVAIVHPLIEKKHLTLRVAIQDDLPKVNCDRTRIRQVVLNLMSNAARFTKRGEITVRAEKRERYVVVCVSDTGPGISPEDASRIFEPFYQATSDLPTDMKGSGLGLSISKQFIDLHDGRLWLESEVGVGSSFFFELPISAPTKPVVRPDRRIREDWEWREQAFKTSRTVSAEELVKPCIVICDETGDLHPRLSHHANEIEFIDTRDLAEATRELQQCLAHALMLNAVTPDGLLPLVEAVRQEIPETPIIGCSVPQATDRAVKAGALGQLVKPVMRGDLEEALQAAGAPVRRVLVVDDDPQVLTLLTRLLHLCDPALEVVAASSGEEALDVACSKTPDLMLLDIVMPGMDGWRVLELMKQDEGIRDVPVFLVSAQDLVDQPPPSRYLVVAMGEGISVDQLLRCSLGISTVLWKPVQEPDRALA